MPEASKQHWLYGPELLRALVAAGVVPAMTQSVEIVATWDDFVKVRADIALSAEQWQAVNASLSPAPAASTLTPSPEDVEKDRMRTIIAKTKAKDAVA